MNSKNVFVLVLAHLEPELELFEVDDIGDDGDDDLQHHYLPNSLVYPTNVQYRPVKPSKVQHKPILSTFYYYIIITMRKSAKMRFGHNF